MSGRDGHEELRARLRAAAGAHEPDRARILARVEHGRARRDPGPRPEVRRPPAGWVRVAGAAVAVAGVVAVGAHAVTPLTGEPAPARRSVAARSTPSAPAPTGRTVRPGATADAGPLRSDAVVDPHSNAYWAQSNLTLSTAEPLSALTVEIRVAQTGGVSATGAWRTLPEDDFAFSAAERNGFVVYRWVLEEGRTVPAGEWVFAAQYDHARGGRDARADTYTATAAAGLGRPAVAGDFVPGDAAPPKAATEPAATAGR
ncbi:hypothetical protein [Streptomyces ziwulingensis]|uniref:DUF3859 domain-containing protein n=1 Tax=Streptomyces ziwulingensis TaxID=1045501 RepID=A0ABP9BN23_9ACTN